MNYKDLVSQLEPSLSNASALVGLLPSLNDNDKAFTLGVVREVLSNTPPETLNNRDLLTYIKLWVKYREPEIKTLSLGDYLDHDQISKLRQLSNPSE